MARQLVESDSPLCDGLFHYSSSVTVQHCKRGGARLVIVTRTCAHARDGDSAICNRPAQTTLVLITTWIVSAVSIMQVRPVSDEAFATVKAGLPPHVAAECDDACIRRFIRASGGNPTTVRDVLRMAHRQQRPRRQSSAWWQPRPGARRSSPTRLSATPAS